MPPRLLRVALTGGIATGKSHCLQRFAALGVPTVDADELSHDLVAPATPGLAAVVARFGPAVRRSDGSLDREALGRLVFGDPAARRDLEEIIHPAVYRAINDWYSGREAIAPHFAIADIPLLFETRHQHEFDRVVVTTCGVEEQLARLIARGLSQAEARQRIDAQLPSREKVSRADYVIDTSGTFDETDRQIVEVFEKLKAQAAAP